MSIPLFLTQIEKTTAEWDTENPVLGENVIGIEIMSNGFNRFKRGNGIDHWRLLPYIDKIPPVNITAAMLNVYTKSETDALLDGKFGAGDVIPVANGGTGRSSLTSGYFLRGNGTSAVTMSSAASARSAMGLGNTTGALPIANGGTGAATANGAANNLCEVGTWTPRLTNVEGSAPTYTTGWNVGSYLKIGTLVWVWCDMALGISNIGGNYAGVSGLPYANDGYCGLHLVEADNVLDLGGNGNIYPNTSVISNMVRFRTPTGADSYNWQTNTSLGTNVGRLRFSGIYRTT